MVLEFRRNRAVVPVRGHDRDVVKVLGGGAYHRRPTDIDVLDEFLESNSGLGGGFFERVQIDHNHIDALDPVLFHGGHVLGVLAAMQNSAMDLGMKGFHAAVKHLGESGEFRDVFYRDPRVTEKLGGASSGD